MGFTSAHKRRFWVAYSENEVGRNPEQLYDDHVINAKDEFFAGFGPMQVIYPASSLSIGDRVRIVGDHPHAGRVGVIEGVYNFKHFPSMSPGVKIVFDDGDGCFVFRPCRLERVNE